MRLFGYTINRWANDGHGSLSRYRISERTLVGFVLRHEHTLETKSISSKHDPSHRWALYRKGRWALTLSYGLAPRESIRAYGFNADDAPMPDLQETAGQP